MWDPTVLDRMKITNNVFFWFCLFQCYPCLRPPLALFKLPTEIQLSAHPDGNRVALLSSAQSQTTWNPFFFFRNKLKPPTGMAVFDSIYSMGSIQAKLRGIATSFTVCAVTIWKMKVTNGAQRNIKKTIGQLNQSFWGKRTHMACWSWSRVLACVGKHTLAQKQSHKVVFQGTCPRSLAPSLSLSLFLFMHLTRTRKVESDFHTTHCYDCHWIPLVYIVLGGFGVCLRSDGVGLAGDQCGGGRERVVGSEHERRLPSNAEVKSLAPSSGRNNVVWNTATSCLYFSRERFFFSRLAFNEARAREDTASASLCMCLYSSQPLLTTTPLFIIIFLFVWCVFFWRGRGASCLKNNWKASVSLKHLSLECNRSGDKKKKEKTENFWVHSQLPFQCQPG